MSIAVLTQVYDEMRRLSIAGSVVAGGDFRLKKLIAPLEQAGAKAPVFARVAEAIKAVVDGSEKTSAQALLELTTLVNAILYTQGETGADGTLEPIETTDLGTPTTQASARVLKPLLEALTTTGSGRLELVRDAHERGAFRDLRLVKPALDAVDDVYAEIADFMTEKVLPLYGKAILPELRAKFDLKGRGGHPRRLQLMHALDPAGARDLVKQALDAGSKEVKVVAIACLGADPADLSYLIEQAGAKAQEVRAAAYAALARLEDDAAIEVLRKAMTGKDLNLAADSLHKSRSAKLLGYLIAVAEEELAGLRKTKDKKEVGLKIGKITSLMNCLMGRQDETSEAFIAKVFAQRDDLAKIKGDTSSGADLNSLVVRLMQYGTRKLQKMLVDTHASLPGADLEACFHAARRALPAAEVYAIFAPFVTAKVDEKKKQRDPAWAKREAIFNALGFFQQQYQQYNYYRPADEEDTGDGKLAALDPRWLDLAVQQKNLGLVQRLIRPGNAAANAFLKDIFVDTLKKAKQAHQCHPVLYTMIRAAHPDAAESLIAVLERFRKEPGYSYGYWIGNLIVDLPKSALPRLEALIPTLDEKVADGLLGSMQQLREKKD